MWGGALLYAGGLLLMRYAATPLSLDLGAGVMIGFGAGYYLGAKAGRERYEQLNAMIRKERRARKTFPAWQKDIESWRKAQPNGKLRSASSAAPAKATVKSGRPRALPPRQASDRFNNAATNAIPKPRLNCCDMLAMLVAELICGCSTSA